MYWGSDILTEKASPCSAVISFDWPIFSYTATISFSNDNDHTGP